MKKRLLSGLLCLVMALALLPTAALALDPVSKIVVRDIDAPVVGAVPDTTAISGPEGATSVSTYVDHVSWLGSLDENGCFKAGIKYGVIVIVKIKDDSGRVFSSSLKNNKNGGATINGNKCNVDSWSEDYIQLGYTFSSLKAAPSEQAVAVAAGGSITPAQAAEYALFDSGTATLTLHNFTYSGVGFNYGVTTAAPPNASLSGYMYSVIYYNPADSTNVLKLVLEGSNNLEQHGREATDTQTYKYSSCGICTQRGLEISGTGKLNVASDTDTPTAVESVAIRSKGDGSYANISISGSATVVATGGAVDNDITTEFIKSCGIKSDYGVTISGSATVVATGGAANRAPDYGSYGIYNDKSNIAISESSTVTASGTGDSKAAFNKAPTLSGYNTDGYQWRTDATNTTYTASTTAFTNEGNPAYAQIKSAGAAPTVSTAAIAGVTAPVAGATPVTAITECDQYKGTVIWSGSPSTFEAGTIYTATITLTPKTGYTLDGVTPNFFTVAGATATNGGNSGIITAVFPVPVSTAAIEGVTAPVAGATPVTAITECDQYTGTVSWFPTVSSTFNYSTTYTATITLTPKTNYMLDGVTKNFFTVAGATATNSADSGIITAVFPATAAPVNASVTPTNATFDKYASATDYVDKEFTLSPGSYTLSAIKIGDSPLTKDTDYTVSGNTYTIKKATLAKLSTGAATITFEMSGGTNPTATVTVSDTTPHVHGSWSYQASGATITATCGADGCTDPKYSENLTISAPTSLTYDGNAKAATLSSVSGLESNLKNTVASSIRYEGVSPTVYESPTIAPTNAGTYKASITVGTDKTASVEYTIAKATLVVDGTLAASANYGTAVKDITAFSGATVKLGSTSGTTVAGSWSFGSSETAVPDAGSTTAYTATFTPGGEAGNYNALTVDVTPTISQIAYTGAKTGTTSALRTSAGEKTYTMPSEISALAGVGYAVKTKTTANIVDTAAPTFTGNVLSYTSKVCEGTDAKSDTITITVSSTNYSDFDFVLTVNALSKTDLSSSFVTSGITGLDKTYNGTAAAYTGSATVTGHADLNSSLVYEYQGTGTTSYNKSATAPANAGTYKLITRLRGT